MIRALIFPTSFVSAAMLTWPALSALAHDDDKLKKLPPTKAKAELAKAREQLDAAKKKLYELNRYNCCVKTAPGSKVPGCDLCAKVNGSCNCGAKWPTPGRFRSECVAVRALRSPRTAW